MGDAWSKQRSMGLTPDGLAGEREKVMNKIRWPLASAGFGLGCADASSPTDFAAALGFPLLLGGKLGGDVERW